MKIPTSITQLFNASNLDSYLASEYEKRELINTEERDKVRQLNSWLREQTEPIENWQDFIFSYIHTLEIVLEESYTENQELRYYWHIYSQLHSDLLLFPIAHCLKSETSKKDAVVELVDRILKFPTEKKHATYIQFSLIGLLCEIKFKKDDATINEEDAAALKYMYDALLSFLYLEVTKPLQYGELYTLHHLLYDFENRLKDLYDYKKETEPFYKLKQVQILGYYSKSSSYPSSLDNFLTIDQLEIEIPSPINTALKHHALAVFDENPKLSILFLRLDVIYKAMQVLEYDTLFKYKSFGGYNGGEAIANTLRSILVTANENVLKKIGAFFKEYLDAKFIDVILLMTKEMEYNFRDDDTLKKEGTALATILLEVRNETSKEKTYKNLEALLAKWKIINPKEPVVDIEIKYREEDEGDYENYVVEEDEIEELLENGSYTKLFFYNNKLKYIEEIRKNDFYEVKYFVDDKEDETEILQKLNSKYDAKNNRILIVRATQLALKSDKYISNTYRSEIVKLFNGTELLQTMEKIYTDEYNQKVCSMVIDANGKPDLTTITKYYYPESHDFVFEYQYEELFTVTYKNEDSIKEVCLYWDEEKAFETFILTVYSSNMKDHRYGEYEDDIITFFKEKYETCSSDEEDEFYSNTVLHLLEIPNYLMHMEYFKTADPYCLELLG